VAPYTNQNVFFSSRLWVHEVTKRKKKHIEGVLFTSGDSGVYCLNASWEIFGWWSESRRTVSCFQQPPSWDGLLGITGVGSKFWFALVATNEREMGSVRFFLLCTIQGLPTYLSCLLSFLGVLFVGHLGHIPERDGRIWRWFLKRCKLSRPGRACLRSPSQASGVTVATDMICVVGRFLGSMGPRAWFCNG